jgi:gas vesicle protein
MRYIIIVGGIVFSLAAASRLLRRRRSSPMRRASKEVKRAVSYIDTTVEDLTERAKKLSGEVRETVEVQVRALEGRREELMEKLDTLATSATKRSKKTEEPVAA